MATGGCSANDPGAAQEGPPQDASRHEQPEDDQLDAEEQQRDQHYGEQDGADQDYYHRREVVDRADLGNGNVPRGFGGTVAEVDPAPPWQPPTDPQPPDAPLHTIGGNHYAISKVEHGVRMMKREGNARHWRCRARLRFRAAWRPAFLSSAQAT